MGRVSVPQRSGLHSNQSGLGTHGFSGYSFSSPSPPPPTSTRFGRGQPLWVPSSSLWREYTCWAYLRPNNGMWNKHGNRWNAHSYMFKVFDDRHLFNECLLADLLWSLLLVLLGAKMKVVCCILLVPTSACEAEVTVFHIDNIITCTNDARKASTALRSIVS